MEDMLKRVIQCIGTKHGESKKLADYLEIHPNTITSWKNGSNMSYRKHAKKIAEYFDVSLEWLLTGEEPSKMAPSGEGEELSREKIKKILETMSMAELAEVLSDCAEIMKRREESQ